MFFFNLTAAEFLTLFGAVSSLVVVLYLLDRSRKKHIVPTLLFWQPSELPSQRKHRRKIQQPWSLLLQLLGILLLLLAIAQLRLGSPERNSRDHVLLMETSAWMEARGATGRSLMTEAKVAAVRYLRALPSGDRLMVVRADALATPVTGFETNRQTLETAIRQLQPGTAALHLGHGLEFATQVLRLEGAHAGEIVFAGTGRMSRESLGEMPALPANLRVLGVRGDIQNVGLKRFAVQRAASDPEVWEIYVTAHNYGVKARSIPLNAAFGGAPAGAKLLELGPGAEASANFSYRTKAAGWLEVRLRTGDAMKQDDSATLELPASASAKVFVYSDEPALLRPLLGANKRVDAVYRSPKEYQPQDASAIVILDRFRPPSPPAGNTIWIDPPANAAPVASRTVARDAALRWRSDQFLASGLRTKEARIDSTQVLASAPGDIPIAEVEGGPVIVARPGKTKAAVFGFHPMRSALRFELAAPILFANVLRWMTPGLFLRVELQAGNVGVVTVPLESEYDASQIKVTAGGGESLPFTIRNRALRFFSGTPGTVRVSLGDRELVYSLSLPEVADAVWTPPSTVRRGFVAAGGAGAAARDLWQWLAIAGALVLLLEWWFFARSGQTWSGPSRTLAWLPFRRTETSRRKAS
ncbi:MAG: VWA domain-containing protein [Candidatus Solibacter usitatus]|nr:VWA domain-containing protein [Candidatus Solibacter usitatus]